MRTSPYAALAALNLFDTGMTLWLTTTGRADEFNPAMALLLLIHPALFLFVKLVMVNLVLAYLWRKRGYDLNKPLFIGLIVGYSIVALLHFTSLAMVLFG